MVLQYIDYIILAIILIINGLIINGDLKSSIIKNKFLGILFIIFLLKIIIYTFYGEAHLLFQKSGIISLFSIFIISFLLSTFRIWGAGDAKYFLVLYLFIIHLSPLIYIANIVIATFLLLLYLFFKSIIFNNQNGIWLGYIISGDFKRWKNNTISKFHESYSIGIMSLLNVINEFFIFFLLIKIAREIFFIFPLGENIPWIPSYINSYFILLIIFIIGVILLRKYLISFRDFFGKKIGITKIESISLFNFFLLILTSTLLLFLYTDFSLFLSEMYKILSIYLLIHVFIRSVLYIYKKCFIEMEKSIIHIDDLKLGDYIDKNWMKGRITPLIQDQKVRVKQHIYSYTQSPEELKEIKRLVKKYYKKEPYVSIINSFPYSPVIFAAFLLTYIYESTYISFIIEKISLAVL